MLKRSSRELDELESRYPDIREAILNIESRDLPCCTACQSDNTAAVQSGVIGRTIAIAASTTKIKLVANGDTSHRYYCNACDHYFS